MTKEQQPPALRYADALDCLEHEGMHKAAAELRRLHARVQELEVRLIEAHRVTVTTKTLEDWKNRVNTLAACSTKVDRYRIGSALKQDIADAIAVMTPQ